MTFREFMGGLYEGVCYRPFIMADDLWFYLFLRMGIYGATSGIIALIFMNKLSCIFTTGVILFAPMMFIGFMCIAFGLAVFAFDHGR